MPNPNIKAYAKKTDKTVAEVESLWKRAEEVVKDEYDDIDIKSDRFYKLVQGVMKKMLKLEMAYTKLKRFNKMYEDTILKFEGMNKDDDEI